MHCKATKVFGSRMQHGNANEMLGLSDANRNPPRRRGYFSRSPEADSIENYNVSRSGYHSTFHQMLRLPQKVTHELHQMLCLPQKVTHELHLILRLPRKMNLMIDPHHI